MAGSARRPIFTRDFMLAAIVNLGATTIFYSLITTMAVYAWRQFNATDTEAGIAASVFVLGATLARLLAGKIIGSLGTRTVLIACTVLATVAAGGYLFATGTLTALIVLRLVHGLGFGFLSTVTIAIAQSMIPAERRAEGTGYFALTSAISTGVGPVLGATLVGAWDYEGLFITMLGLSVLTLVFALLLSRAPLPKGSGRPIRFGLSGWIERRVLPIAGYMLVLGIVYSGILAYLDAHGLDQVGPGTAGVFFFAYSAALILSRFIIGRVQDVHGDNSVMYPAILCFAASLLLVGVMNSSWLAAAAGALAGIGFGTVLSGMQAIAVAATPPPNLALGVSTFFFMLDLGVGLGPVLLGFLVSATDFTTMFVVLSAITLVSTIGYHLLHGRTPLARRHRRD